MTTLQDFGALYQIIWFLSGLAMVVYDFKKHPRRTLDIAHILMILFGPVCWTCFISYVLYIYFRRSRDSSFDLNDPNSHVAVHLVMGIFGILPWVLFVTWLETQ